MATVSPRPCKLIVHIIKGENLLKMDENSSDPYVSLEMKDQPNDYVYKSKTVDHNNVNPVWNQTFEYQINDWNTEVLLINLYDEDLKNDQPMMDQLEFPVKQWPIESHIDFEQDIKLNGENAGKLFFRFEVLEPNNNQEEQIQEREVQESQNKNDEPVEHRRKANKRIFSLGNFSSDYSTDFTGYSDFEQSLSEMRSSEEVFHQEHQNVHKENEQPNIQNRNIDLADGKPSKVSDSILGRNVHNENEQPNIQNRDIDLADGKPSKVSDSIVGKIVKANGIPKTDSKGSNTYVVLTVVPKSGKMKNGDKVKTDVQRCTQDPIWNKEFDFQFATLDDSLRIEIFEIQRILGDKCIACCEVFLKDLKENQPITQTFKLTRPPKTPKIVKKVVDFGTITLSLTHNVQYK